MSLSSVDQLLCEASEESVLVSCSTSAQSENGEQSTSNKRPSTKPAAQRNAKKKSAKGDENMDTLLMEQAIAVINKPHDDYEIFGQFVASELRQIYDLVQRNTVKGSIISVLMTHGSLESSANGHTSETLYVTVVDDDQPQT